LARTAAERSEHFDSAQAARIVGVTPRRLRECVRAGLVSSPRDDKGRLRFGFIDLVVLRTMRGLLAKGVPLTQVGRVLESLRRQIGERPLTRLTIYADGRRVVAWDGESRWQPDSGQFLFNFPAARVLNGARKVAAIRPPAKRAATKRSPPMASADEWCDLALELEHDSPEEACAAYRKAIKLDPSAAMAHINLGCLLHAASKYAAAERHYRKALASAGDHQALGWYNLGVLLEDRARPAEALPSYERAVAADPELADAHYNLALLYEHAGRKQEAVRHFAIYKRLERRR
jgi:tetratricopeptide (TPR) repeat protein